MKASTTICSIELSFSSSRVGGTFQAKDRSTLRQHHEGVQFAAFHYFAGTAVAKGFPV